MKRYIILLILLVFYNHPIFAQKYDWQQRADYRINIKLDVTKHLINGHEDITYYNNAPHALDKLFLHLYWNAFQPGSLMDERSLKAGKDTINKKADWDTRVRDRISSLQTHEIGYQKIKSIKINGQEQKFSITGTLLQVHLKKPLLPKSKNNIQLIFEAQVPVQIRRAGRNNAEGVKYSMTQWYPKIAGYDTEGWHPYQYIGREFYAPFGNYEVNITLDSAFTIAGTGTLQKTLHTKDKKQKTWQFKASNVHDFAWAADDHFIVHNRQIKNGPLFSFVYKNSTPENNEKWLKLADQMEALYPFIKKTFGAYQYPNYSFIQGGDGGMEYPMATLMKHASIGLALHEFGHNWYQGVLASNEALHPWMDEGGASYFEDRTMGHLKNDSLWYLDGYKSYYHLVKNHVQEPLTTHGDCYMTNATYSLSSYGKGFVFYTQLSYLIGQKAMDKFLIEYEKRWRFKHPAPNDLIRVAEDISGMQLQWYRHFWIGTIQTIDYGIQKVIEQQQQTQIYLQKIGAMPMPLDILIHYKDGSKAMYHIPIDLTFGHKKPENNYYTWHTTNTWTWTKPNYILTIEQPLQSIEKIEIDPSKRLADINHNNNIWTSKP